MVRLWPAGTFSCPFTVTVVYASHVPDTSPDTVIAFAVTLTLSVFANEGMAAGVAVMVAEPGFMAVTTPFATVATSLSEDVHSTVLSSTFSGKNCTLTFRVSPGVSVVAVGSMVNLLRVTVSSSSLHDVVTVADVRAIAIIIRNLIAFFILFFLL